MTQNKDKAPSWFDKAGAENAEQIAEDKKREAALVELLPGLLKRQEDKGRAQKFQPYLLIRSVLGDRGDRPINLPFWESPDIWTAAGAPPNAPDLPPDHGGVVTAGQPNTVYAHVWNLGFAPLAGICVEFYWFNPSLGIDGTDANLIGVARIELGGRGSPNSHRLVKCPTPWIPVMENGGHECLVVRVSGIGDAIGNNPWAPWANRHVGQRNVSVVAAAAGAGQLMTSLKRTRVANSRVELVQLDKVQGDLARVLVASGLKVAAAAETHLVGELAMDGTVTTPAVRAITPAMRMPVHPMAHGLTAVEPRVVDVARPAPPSRVAPRATATPAAPPVTRAEDIAHFLPAAKRGEVQVLRVASYNGAQLIGGYTMVVTGGA